MDGFYWLIEGVLAGCSRPGARRGVFPDAVATIDGDLAWLRERGIGAVLSLTETPLPAEAIARHDFAYLHLPVPDMTPPLPDQFMAALLFLDRQRMAGRPAVVHCLVGQGRTGAILAAHLIRGGLDVATALARVRAVRPGAVENPAQERALAEFAGRRDWIV
jgi:atypical dual specificity phosphatase